MVIIDDASVALSPVDIRGDLIPDRKYINQMLESFIHPDPNALHGVAEADTKHLSPESLRIYQALCKLAAEPNKIERFKNSMLTRKGGATPVTKSSIIGQSVTGNPNFTPKAVGGMFGQNIGGIGRDPYGSIPPTSSVGNQFGFATPKTSFISKPDTPKTGSWLDASTSKFGGPPLEMPHNAPTTSTIDEFIGDSKTSEQKPLYGQDMGRMSSSGMNPASSGMNPAYGQSSYGMSSSGMNPAYGQSSYGMSSSGMNPAYGQSSYGANPYETNPNPIYSQPMGRPTNDYSYNKSSMPRLNKASGRWAYLSEVDPAISSIPDGQYDFGQFLRGWDPSNLQLQSEITRGMYQTAQTMPAGDRRAVMGGISMQSLNANPSQSTGIAELFQMQNLAFIRENMINEMIEWYEIIGQKPPTSLNQLDFTQLVAHHRQLKERMDSECTKELTNGVVTMTGRGVATIFDGETSLFGFRPNLKGPNRNLGKRFSQMQDKGIWKYSMRQGTRGLALGSAPWVVMFTQMLFETVNTAFENAGTQSSDPKRNRRAEILDGLQNSSW